MNSQENVGANAPLYWSWWGWEPLHDYRRRGGVVGAVDGSAVWLDAWYERLHTEELVQQMAALGINLLFTHFFKGYGLHYEASEHQRLQELVQIAHRHDMKVMGYTQSNSLYNETFLAENPDAAEWTQRDEQGKIVKWTYYRWRPCIMKKQFRAYIKRVLQFGVKEMQLDGFFFDNDYSKPCYCDTCEEAFRQWLQERFPHPQKYFGIPSFEHVAQPPTLDPPPAAIYDPLVRAWVRFRCEKLAEYHHDITGEIRLSHPKVLFCGNPAYPRRAAASYELSVWPPLIGSQLDLMFAENGNFPGLHDDVLVSQIRGFKQGNAVGYRAISTTWNHGHAEFPAGLPETAAEVELQIAEAAANGGVPGTNWALRPLGKDDRMRIDRPELREALQRALDFVRDAETRLAGATPVCDIAVLRTFASFSYDAAHAEGAVLATEEALIRGGFSWNTLFGENLTSLENYAVLLVAGQTHLSEAECAAIRQFVRDGGAVVLIGQNALRDEWGRTRNESELSDLSGANVIRIEEEFPETTYTRGSAIHVSHQNNWAQIVAGAVEQVANQNVSVRLRGSDQTSVTAYQLPSGELAVHLVNYATPQPARGLRLEITRAKSTFTAAEFWALGASSQNLLPIGESAISFEIPPFQTYGILIIK